VGNNAPALEGAAIEALLTGLSRAAKRAERAQRKSLGRILALQDEIGRRWADALAGAPADETGEVRVRSESN
jgi:hypothetical protein